MSADKELKETYIQIREMISSIYQKLGNLPSSIEQQRRTIFSNKTDTNILESHQYLLKEMSKPKQNFNNIEYNQEFFIKTEWKKLSKMGTFPDKFTHFHKAIAYKKHVYLFGGRMHGMDGHTNR
jgi:hypothetical protein